MDELALTGAAAIPALDHAPDCLAPTCSLLEDDWQVTIANGGGKALGAAQNLARSNRPRAIKERGFS